MDNKNSTQTNFNKEEAYIRAKKKFDKLKGFYWHLAAYIVVNIFLFTTIAANQEDGNIWHFGTFATPLFWGIGLGFHAFGVFGKNILFGKKWENRKIQEYMNKDKNHWE